MTLEQTVVAALANSAISAAELNVALTAVDNGIAAAERDATKQRELAYDPTATPDLREARQQLDDALILIGRLQTLRSRLERKLAQVLAAEQQARWLQDYNEVSAKRDQAVELFEQYPDLIVRLLTILHTAKEVDAEVTRINNTAPPGEHRRLLGVELTARNLKTFSVLQPSIASRISIPDLTNASRTLWPPPQQFTAPPPPSFDPRYSSSWGELKAQQEQLARDDAEREREQFEKNAEAAQRASGAPVWWKRYGHPVE